MRSKANQVTRLEELTKKQEQQIKVNTLLPVFI